MEIDDQSPPPVFRCEDCGREVMQGCSRCWQCRSAREAEALAEQARTTPPQRDDIDDGSDDDA